MEEKAITQEDSLRIIESMIESTKKKVTKLDSYYSLLWGYLVLTASLLHYYLLEAGYGAKAPNAWFLMLIGGMASFWISIKRNKERKVKTYFDNVLFYLWTGFVISIFLIILNGKYVAFQITPLILLLYGFVLMINGGIFNFKPQMVGAVISWIACFVAFRLEFKDQLLVEALVVLLSYIVPGHILYSMAKKNV